MKNIKKNTSTLLKLSRVFKKQSDKFSVYAKQHTETSRQFKDAATIIKNATWET